MSANTRGIISHAGYVPYRRLDRSAIAATFGGTPARGTRSVAAFDEDTTTMAVEAGRLALRATPAGIGPDALWFATAAPAYQDKTNATAIHAALRLDSEVPAVDMTGALRSASGALLAALRSRDTVLVVSSDVRTGLPTSADEAEGGDAAAALLVGGPDQPEALLAEVLGTGSTTEEFVDRWRAPGEVRSRQWEERFGETRYVPLGERAWTLALKAAELTPDAVDRVAVVGLHSRAVRSLAGRLGVGTEVLADTLTATVGTSGAAHPGLVLSSMLEQAEPGQVLALVVLADGADVFLFRTTDAVASRRPARPVADQVAAAADLPYGKFLAWKGVVEVQPPNRPAPERPSSSAAARSGAWKYGFVGAQDRESGAVHLPPARVSMAGGKVDDMVAAPMADAGGTIVTYTVDRLVYSPSPPVVFAVIDFDGGGRLACELTDVDPDEVAIGGRVEMTFRRLFTSDGIHNYFWKARPARATADTPGTATGTAAGTAAATTEAR